MRVGRVAWRAMSDDGELYSRFLFLLGHGMIDGVMASLVGALAMLV